MASKKIFLAMTVVFCLCACGDADRAGEIAVPVLVRIDPETAQIGDELVVFGSGFSPEEDNILFLGGIVVIDTDWDLASTGLDGEEEQIRFDLPAETQLGEQELIVMTGNKTSNALVLTVVE